MSSLSFELLADDHGARRGRVHTTRGAIETPAFMPVGTAATVKAMLPEQVRATGADIILSNTYHLMLRPGDERIARLGGLHHFMNWHRPILTDSGGYQVMSLGALRKISEDGVTFKSHIDGAKVFLSPERSMEIQKNLGSDIVMAFDECTPFPAEKDEVARSMELSMRWAKRSHEAFGQPERQALFGIVQGGVHGDLRRVSIDMLTDIGFPGYAVGGLAVGEGQELMLSTLEATTPHMPVDRPRYLMGVGKPSDLVGAVARGIDMFDCVMPTRSGRNAQGFTDQGPINLRNAKFGDDPDPIDPSCPCLACKNYSQAYLHHLFRAGEMLGPILLTHHNLAYYQSLMARMRGHIEQGSFAQFAQKFMG
ncbi:MAG TPA: tRNA guanosine(34) transglycosylase Tgt [Alphaproteobacteria bacterium]|nr:MAG: tRNA guanosine(34) transglycosylase Tgt [SAR116 cluster bacterium]HBQ22171.1 tRNA guanosine(34) transglycosylase Tgt [Alphaproteobacteria bacterium]HCY48209.1 tRNA guanosine(34) transglycosylase Tgt [Alphaproteobacteria bacterium]|tara:strand:+ start:459 stop:1556 length:1098 start_codon:yes stop_codon:yes gene_type:complete